MWPQHYKKTVKKHRIRLSRRFNQFMQHHDIAEILIKLAYNTNQSIYSVDMFIPENIQSLICSGSHLICRYVVGSHLICRLCSSSHFICRCSKLKYMTPMEINISSILPTQSEIAYRTSNRNRYISSISSYSKSYMQWLTSYMQIICSIIIYKIIYTLFLHYSGIRQGINKLVYYISLFIPCLIPE